MVLLPCRIVGASFIAFARDARLQEGSQLARVLAVPAPPARADPRAGDPVSVVSLLELVLLWEYPPLGVTMAFAMVALVRDTIVAIWRTGTRRVTLLLDKRPS
jgi:hypothetical protein